MKGLFFLLSALVLLLLPVSHFGINPKMAIQNNAQVRVVKNKPSVYISFEREGKREPLYPEESTKGIWLRLHNNTRWTIYFCAFDVPSIYGERGLYHEVEKLSVDKEGGTYKDSADKAEPMSSSQASQPPVGYRNNHTCRVFRLLSGKSILFSVPREHLGEGLAIKIAFNYSWENLIDVIEGTEPEHYAYFYSTRLPVKERAKK